jgi:hypothetical protein
MEGWWKERLPSKHEAMSSNPSAVKKDRKKEREMKTKKTKEIIKETKI